MVGLGGRAASSKVGSGKTMVALHLAVAAHAAGYEAVTMALLCWHKIMSLCFSVNML